METAISVDSLLELPQGAAYHKKSGQAGVEVTRQGRTIYIAGTCDSLQRQVEYYEALYHTARDALQQHEASYNEERKQRTNPAKVALAFFIAGIFTVAITTIIIISKRKRQ